MTGVKNAVAEREAEDGDRLTELGKTASTGVKTPYPIQIRDNTPLQNLGKDVGNSCLCLPDKGT